MERHREFAHRMYEALNRRDLDAFIGGVAEDAEFRSLLAEAEGEVYRGHEGVRRWWTDVAEGLGGVGFELQDYVEEGDGSVMKLRVRALHGTTGIEQGMWMGAVIRAEKVVWWQTFRTEDEAWEAVRTHLSGGDST